MAAGALDSSVPEGRWLERVASERLVAQLLAGIQWLARRPGVYIPLFVALSLAQVIFVDHLAAPVDYDLFVRGGRALLSGHLSTVFAQKSMQSGPVQLALIGGTGLLSGIRRNLDVVAFHCALTTVWVALMPFAVRRLRAAFHLPRSSIIELTVPACALVLGVGDGLTASGHPAELLIPPLWVVAGLLLLDGHPVAAGLTLGLTPGLEPWGVLGAPLLLLARTRRDFFLSAIVALLLATSLYLPFVASGHFALFGFRWTVSNDSIDHLLWPHAHQFTWGMRLLQGAAALAAGAVAAVRVRERRDQVWLAVLVVVLVRLTFDPLLLAYYWLEVGTLVLVGMTTLRVRQPRTAAVLAGIAYLQTLQSHQTHMVGLAATLVAVTWLLLRPHGEPALRVTTTA